MGDRSADIMRVEPLIEADAFAELLDAAIRRLIEDSRPGFSGHSFPLLDTHAQELGTRVQSFTLNGVTQSVN
jgi:hypothetical protein